MNEKLVKLRKLWYLAFIICSINFLCFFIEAGHLGGDGLNGYTRNGRCYVVNHSVVSEVTESQWKFSRYHALSVIITQPIVIGIGIYLNRKMGKKFYYGNLYD